MGAIPLDEFIKANKPKLKLDASVSYYTVSEYAERIGRSTQVVHSMCRNGVIESEKDGKKYWIKVDTLANHDDLIKENDILKEENAALKKQMDCIKAVVLS